MNRSTEQRTPTDGSNTLTPRTMTRRIGRTTYRVNVHFNQNSKETANDKIIRMVKNETAGKAAGQ